MPNSPHKETISGLTIERLGAQADGIGVHGDLPIYVQGALPGDTVTAQVIERKRGGIYAELSAIEKPSQDRIDPICQHYGLCGGCQIQHIAPAAYKSWISERVTETLARQGVEGFDLHTPLVVEPGTRRRVTLKAIKTISGVVLGFNAKKSHQIIDMRACPVAVPAIVELLPSLRRLLNAVATEKSLLMVDITETSTGLDVLIEGATAETLDTRERLAEFADTHDLARLQCMRDGQLDPVSVRREPVMQFGGVPVALPAGAFTQAAQVGEDALVQTVLSATKGLGRVADLFCGLGTFTFPLARHHQVLAVEGAHDAVVALENGRNAAQARGIKLKQMITKHRDLFRRPITAEELKPFDAVVIDPPRAGAVAQMTEIARSEIKRVVSVSCNINTFARDIRCLQDGGYVLRSVQPVDQFLWSHHLELVGILDRI